MCQEGATAVLGRSFLVVGTAVVSAAAVALAPPVTPRPATQLTAAVLPLDTDLLILAPSAAAASSIGDGIETLYLALEPWVQYGVNLFSWAVGWVPFLGLLAPQINFFYDLDEAVVQSMLFNTVDFLDGTIGFDQALSNIDSDTTAAFNTFIDTEIAWLHHFFPPPPPVAPLAASPTELTDAATAVPGLATAMDAGAALDPSTLVDLGALADPTSNLGEMLLSLVP